MKYNAENIRLWNLLRSAAERLGTDLSGLNGYLSLAEGTLEVMEEYDIPPEGEILARLRRLLGMTEKEILSGEEEDLSVEVIRDVFVLKKADFDKPYRDMENVITNFTIDRPAGDDREYVGILVKDESMKNARIHKGDIVIIRRQALAEDGELVAAEADGETVIRRFHRQKDIIWLEAEGSAGKGKTMITDNLNAINRRIRIWGKVIWVTRNVE